ncbi:hypothetical protein E2320_009318 [Naja naja]|nr:hypothetical protein E2320_009318 [Naja naja]
MVGVMMRLLEIRVTSPSAAHLDQGQILQGREAHSQDLLLSWPARTSRGCSANRMWLRATLLLLLLLLFRTSQGNQGCSGTPDESCPFQEVYTRARDVTEIPKSVAPIITEMFFVDTSIVEIRQGAFMNMPNLVKIVFLNNKIKRVEAGAFENLENLVDLEITGAELGDLPVGTFRSLDHLRRVNLRDSHMRRIQKGLFDSLGDLEEIYLHRNEIASLPGGVFDGLPKLSLLHLGWNQISNVSRDLFKHLTQLKTLRLQNNQVGSLGEGSLDSLQQLVELNLESNRLQTLPPNLLSRLVNLEKISLDKNSIEVLPDETFLGLRKVKQLKMASNHLKAFPPLGTMQLLKELDLSRNRISSLENLAGASLPSLTTLKLQGNHLETLPTGQLDHLGNLTSLYLGDNPWRCDCHLLSLHQWMKMNAKRIKDAKKLVCRSPGDLAGNEVGSLSRDQLVCLTTTPTFRATFKATPLPISASPSATSARRSTIGASAQPPMLQEATPTTSQAPPTKSTQITVTSRPTAPTSTQTPTPSSPFTPPQSSTSARTSPEVTSHQAPTSTSPSTTNKDTTTVSEISSTAHEIISTTSPATTRDATTVTELPCTTLQAPTSTSPSATTQNATTEISSIGHQSTFCTDTLTTDAGPGTRTTEATAPWGTSSKTPPTVLTNSSSATSYEPFTVPKRSTETQDPPTRSPVISMSPVCSSRPSVPELSSMHADDASAPQPPGLSLGTSLCCRSPFAFLSFSLALLECWEPLPSPKPALLPQHQAWGFLLGSNSRYCRVFLLLYLSMLSVGIFCAVVFWHTRLHKATESVQLPPKLVRLVHVKARQGRE